MFVFFLRPPKIECRNHLPEMPSPNTRTRALLPEEARRMRKQHLIFFPALLIAGAVLWVVMHFDAIPDPARWAGGAIATLAIFIFGMKHVKLERDLRAGSVALLTGVVTRKHKLGGTRSSTEGIHGRTHKTGSSATYYLCIDGKSFTVPFSIYRKAEEGDQVRLEYFPESQFYLDLIVL